MKILVTGGNGLIGSEVCRVAVDAGHEVIGLARRGRPGQAAAWTERVRWVAADVLEPASWRDELRGVGAVVHCVGIARENPARGNTFQRINGDSAITAAGEAARAGVEALVYLSASARPPFLRESYLAAKRRAEAEIARLPLRFAILRPGLVYGAGRPVSLPAALVVGLAAKLPVVGAMASEARPLPVETVARAAIRAATDSSVRGILDIGTIERLGG